MFSASCTVVEHCDINNLRIEKGTNIFPGYYKVKVKGFHLPEKAYPKKVSSIFSNGG